MHPIEIFFTDLITPSEPSAKQRFEENEQAEREIERWMELADCGGFENG